MSKDKKIENKKDEIQDQEKVTLEENSASEKENSKETEQVEQKEPEIEEEKEPTWEEKYAELNDKYIRIHAEFDNYRKRTNKEKIDIISNANASLLRDLIPVVDDLERAIQNNENNDDIDSVKEGFNLIFNKFISVLKSKGLEAMDSLGSDFDAEIHEAIAKVPAPSKKEKGKVIDTVEKGYKLNDKVIRYAKVVVGH